MCTDPQPLPADLAGLHTALKNVTAERDEARARLLEFGEMYDREDKRVAAEIEALESERDAALAKIERLSYTDGSGAVWRPVPAWSYFALSQELDSVSAENDRLRARLGQGAET